jgi:predicted AlkP superfamily pyrophosphatase or phosphodiesterase
VTAAKQGQRSATMFWVGSEAEIQGHRPTYWHQYNGRMTHRQRIDQIIEWLCLPAAKRPTFLTLYFSDTDSVGHAHGPDSREIINTILNLDYTMGILIDELKQLGIFNKINIIVLSDHGMTEISQDRRIILSDYISLDDVYINDLSTLVALNPKADKLDLVYNQLKDKHPKLKVYKKADVPPRLRYSKHRRISEIIGIADEGWLVVANHDHNIDYAATHGYDPAIASMQGIFIGYGPAFRSGLTSPSFENIHIYNLIAHILNLKPAPNDGDFNIVKHLLR